MKGDKGTGLGVWGTRNDGPKRRHDRGVPRGWCYLCGEEHLFVNPCVSLSEQRWYARATRTKEADR